MKKTIFGIVAAFLVAALALVGGIVIGTSAGTARADSSHIADKRDFLFQVAGYKTKNQGGQTINLYFHYRYNDGIADTDIPNYVDLRTEALKYLNGIDTTKNPYWETLDKTLCTQLKSDFPIEAISCQMQVYPDNRKGLPYEPGFHGTIYTIGDIEPLAVPGPVPGA
jgi:hypothetical protein